MGLIAHELAHSIAELPDYQSDEQEADSQAGCWGFDEELAMLKVEQQNSDNKNHWEQEISGIWRQQDQYCQDILSWMDNFKSFY